MSNLHDEDVAAWFRTQRECIAKLLKKRPSLRHLVDDAEWDEEVWADALEIAGREAGLDDLPKVREWTLEQVLADDYLPS